MKQLLYFIISFLPVFSFAQTDKSAAQSETTLWYEQPAANWDEALPVGNGRLGAMVFGNYVREQIQLNEESIWGGSKVDGNADARGKIQEVQSLLLNGKIKEASQLSEEVLKSDPLRIRSYQPLGDIFIDFYNTKFSSRPRKADNYRRELDIERGLALTTYDIDGCTYTREVFAPSKENVIAIRLKASKPGQLTFKLSLSRDQDAIVTPISNNELLLKGQVVDLPEAESGPPGLHLKFASIIIGQNKGGTLQTVNNSFFVENADEVCFYLTAASDYNFALLDYDRTIIPEKVCADIIAPLRNKEFEGILKSHEADHRAMFNRVSFCLTDTANRQLPTDKRLKAIKDGKKDSGLAVLLFNYGRYLLMSSSRAPGVLPANLQGIWNPYFNAPWNSDFHTNINIQMNYWPAEVCNLSETAVPFLDFISALRVPGRETASKTFDAKGWTVNHLSDIFGHTSISDGVGWGTFPIAATWLALHQWEHYQFTQDKEYLRSQGFPCMKEAAEFILSFVVKDKNGKWVTAPSNSPENRYKTPSGEKFQLTYGAAMDIQLIRELFKACIQAGTILDEDKKLTHQMNMMLKDFPPTKVSQRYGIIQEWIEDYEETEPGHRHMSQLFALYPGTEIVHEEKELFEAARKTIERREFYGKNGQGSSPGWSKAWMINFQARLQNGDAAGKKVNEILEHNTITNLFNSHPPFQIDGNLGFTAGVAEMLLQSHRSSIDLLPALPTAWGEGEIRGLKARGGFEVSIKWSNGKLLKAEVKSLNGNPLSLTYKGKTIKKKTQPGKSYIFSF